MFDTNVALSALRFQSGQLGWLRGHWAAGEVRALASAESIAELLRVLAYPRFSLSADDIRDLLADYLPHVEVVRAPAARQAPRCRDAADQKFLDLALAGGAQVLVTGDKDLLSLSGRLSFDIETPANYGRRFRSPR